MDGNEDKCLSCIKPINDDQYFTCDSCLGKIHKSCANLTASESKCMPLQKRLLLLMCTECRKLLARLPYIMKILDEVKNDLDTIKNNKEMCNSMTTCNTYAEALSSNRNQASKPRIVNTPTLVIKPKKQQDIKQTQAEIEANINPMELKIGINSIRPSKQGNMIIKCPTQRDFEAMKENAEKTLKNNYEIKTIEMNSPRIKIIGVKGTLTKEEIELGLRKQNKWISEEDNLQVTHIRKNKNKEQTIFATCSSKLFHKMMDLKKVFLNWERYMVYEDLLVTRCFNCQGFYHKQSNCVKKKICCNCGLEHDTSLCRNNFKKCVNCTYANSTFKTKYDAKHSANDPACPSYKYHLEVLRRKTDYSL